MSHITFVDQQTVVPAAWLNDVDTVAYTYLGDGTNLTGTFSTPTGVIESPTDTRLMFGINKVLKWGIGASADGFALFPNVDNSFDIGLSSVQVRTGYFKTSVVTPLVTTTSGDLITDSFTGIIRPNIDNSRFSGSPSFRWNSVFTTTVDSGSTGALSLKTNSGTEGFRVVHTPLGVNFWAALSNSTGNGAVLTSIGSDANVTGTFRYQGTGGFVFQNDAASATQLSIVHTVSANRNITITGSNGGNPTISTTAGSLAITPAVVLGSTITGPSNMLSPITNSLGADVLLNNTANYFDGPSIAQGTSGTWFVSGTVTITDTVSSAPFTIKLWDGTTIIASTITAPGGAGNFVTASLSGFISSPAGNLRISVKDGASVNGKIIFNASGNSKDSTITAIRIA